MRVRQTNRHTLSVFGMVILVNNTTCDIVTQGIGTNASNATMTNILQVNIKLSTKIKDCFTVKNISKLSTLKNQSMSITKRICKKEQRV